MLSFIYKYGIIKFWYIVASCWIFLYQLYYDARIHEHQMKSVTQCNENCKICAISQIPKYFYFISAWVLNYVLWWLKMKIPMATWSKAWSVAACLLGLWVQIPPRGMDVCPLWMLCVVRQFSPYSHSLWTGRSGDQLPVGARFSAPVQTGSEAHPASNTMGTGSFSGVKWLGQGVDHPPSI